MSTLEEVVKKIRIKFKILDLAAKEKERIISRNKVKELVKKQKAFEKRLDEINDLKVAAEEFMLIRVKEKLRIELNYIIKQFRNMIPI